ncbi:MAG: ribokinase [Pseudomonadota bacterium]
MIYNLGSINLDLVYGLDTLPQAGETCASNHFEKFLGGKGINQSVAAHAAGANVRHIGAVGPDGDWVRERIRQFGLKMDGIKPVQAATGHAIVAVDKNGENQIILHGGSNQAIPFEWITEQALDIRSDDFALCQNETNLTRDFAKLAQERGARVVLSAAPFDAKQVQDLRDFVYLLAVNEGEAAALADASGQAPVNMGFPLLLVTKGSKGASVYVDGAEIFQPAFEIAPVDTTGAGDTFLGSFVGRLDQEYDLPGALRYAAAASALQVTQMGAASAIPSKDTVYAFMKENT